MKYQLEITIDENALKESGMTAIDYIRQEMGWVEESGLSLGAITPMEPSYPLRETSGTPFLEPGEDLNQRVTKADWEAFREDNPQARIEHFIMRGDVIATDLVHHLTSKMGPAIYNPLKETLLQMGSPCDFQKNEQGELAPRFFTLARTEDTWHYQGHCFAGEREERADAVYYEPKPMLTFTDEAGRQELVSLNVYPSVDAGCLWITASHLVAEAGLMEHYSDVTSFLEPMPYLQAAISPDDIETGLVGWLDENGFGQIVGTCEDGLGFTYVVYAFDEDKLKGIDPLCFAVYRDAAQVKHYYFTFGSSEHLPYQGGHVEVQAQSREEAIRLFRSHYPDRHEGIVNCAFVYDQNEWNKTPRDSDRDCHRIITSPGLYAVMLDQENKENSVTASDGRIDVNGNEKSIEGTYWDHQGKYQAFVNEAIKKSPQVGYTDNPNMNLFIAANNIYYDLYNNGSCNIRDCYRDDVKEYIKPIFRDFKISRFIKEDFAYAEQFTDRVVEYLQDKSLDYQAFPMWLNHEHCWISLAEPEGEWGWNHMVFGDEALQVDRLEYWTKNMGYTDATADFLKASTKPVLEDVTEEAKTKKEQSGKTPRYEYRSIAGNDEQVELSVSTYTSNGNLFVGLRSFNEEWQGMEPYGDVTVNIARLPYLHACIDTNNLTPDILEFLTENGLGEPIGQTLLSGYCEYPVFRFNEEPLCEADPASFAQYQQIHEEKGKEILQQAFTEESEQPLEGLIKEAKEKAAEKNSQHPEPPKSTPPPTLE